MIFEYISRVAVKSTAVLLGAAMLMAAPADRSDAATLTTAIVLSVDGSGSISSSNFALQTGAYASLLSTISTDGSVAIGVRQFSATDQLEFALQVIDSVAKRTALVDTFTNMTQLNSLTAIGTSIANATADLVAFGCSTTSAFKCLIDVSTDGVNNAGVNPGAATAAALAAGVDQVNCIGVGAGANCGFIGGVDSFSILTSDFAGFETALRTKLAREGVIDPNVVPLPAGAWLLLGGLGALTALRRKKAA